MTLDELRTLGRWLATNWTVLNVGTSEPLFISGARSPWMVGADPKSKFCENNSNNKNDNTCYILLSYTFLAFDSKLFGGLIIPLHGITSGFVSLTNLTRILSMIFQSEGTPPVIDARIVCISIWNCLSCCVVAWSVFETWSQQISRYLRSRQDISSHVFIEKFRVLKSRLILLSERGIYERFQQLFLLLPLFAVIEQQIFVVHGGLFRTPEARTPAGGRDDQRTDSSRFCG